MLRVNGDPPGVGYERVKRMKSFTLYGPKSLTLQANFTLRPAGTVIFPISSTNSGSGTLVTETTVTEIK